MARYNRDIIDKRAFYTRRLRRMEMIVPIVISAITVLILMVYLISMMYTKFGSFTVSINKFDQLSYGLSLSETRDFASPTSYLNCRASEEITNIDGKDLDSLPLGETDGVDNGSNYVCYTFYCRNSGEFMVTYRTSILIANMTMGIEEAIRVRVISTYNTEESEKVDYAHPKGVDSYGNTVPEEGTTPFYLNNTIMRKDVENFKPNDVMKYTIVIWLEGNDADCVDPVIGGEFKIDMKFEILTSSVEGE